MLDTTLILIFAGIGLLDTSYLIYHTITKTDVHCLFFPKEWCYKVQHSKQSKTFGVSNSYWGFLMYSAIFLLTLGLVNGLAIPFWITQVIIGVGFLFSVYFTFVQAFILRAFCTWCVVSAINFVVLTVSAFLL